MKNRLLKNVSSFPETLRQNTTHKPTVELTNSKAHLRTYLLRLLENLHDVEQSPLYHPEGNALYHSLQVYQCAHVETDDPELLATALLHDVGKAIDYPNHDYVGAESVLGLLSPRIVWLIRHHLDLLVSPQKTRRRLAGTFRLMELEKLRRWDLAGRNPNVDVIEAHEAIDTLFVHFHLIVGQASDSNYSD